MKKILTIVVPAFNSEKTIGTTLDSLISIGSSIEVIVINDGSTDGTPSVVDEYIHNYPSIVRMISKENGGHGSAINIGVQEATGLYFKVIDSDDWVDTESMYVLVDYLKKQTADIVYSGFLWAYDNGSEDVSSFETKAQFNEPFEGVEYFKVYQFDEIASQLYLKMHNLSFKTDILRKNSITVDEKCYYEDTEYVIYPIPFVETIAFINRFVYMYRIGTKTQSMSREKLVKHYSDYLKVMNSNLAFYRRIKDSVSKAKCKYLEKMLSSYYVSLIKIILLKPFSLGNINAIRTFDKGLKSDYPGVYISSSHFVLRILRLTFYWAYIPAFVIIRLIKRYRY